MMREQVVISTVPVMIKVLVSLTSSAVVLVISHVTSSPATLAVMGFVSVMVKLLGTVSVTRRLSTRWSPTFLT